MTIQPNPTPKQEYEWLLAGLLPKGAIAVVENEIDRLEDQIRKTQLKLAYCRTVVRDIKNDNWPKDNDGFLTQSPDNPL